MSPIANQIELAYREKFAKSAPLFERGQAVFPSGVTHDGRYLEPFPIYVTEAHGARKTTVEGHSIIDYWVGHGAMLLGHGFPAVVRAVQRQMTRGTHFSACHELELEWAERIQRLVPSAERVRFTSSGTEATLMAVRIARLVTGRKKIAKFVGHFHGWHDFLVPAAYAPYTPENWAMPGVTAGVLDDLIVMPPLDLQTVEQVFREQQPACCILEPTGGHWGLVPIRRDFLQGLRELCTRYGVVLVFDEVITGFRVHPGGAQAHYSVIPDLTTLAKVLAGGLPGGAVCGRADLLEALAFGNRYGRKMKHPGTYNGNPLSAAAGCAALDALADGGVTRRANDSAQQLRQRLNELFVRKQIPWIAYGEFSMIHLHPNYAGPRPADPNFIPHEGAYRRLDVEPPAPPKFAFRVAMLTQGVDWFGWSGMTSAAHTEADLDETVAAFDRALEQLRAQSML
ncbi:aspartate aminotransferase family protein [Schlesneria paludicola]|uniref:aspartate aminotransferase family protein n=1 Tax=Schlesneria paludicola TaxID=360056 RepID=UPI00029ACDC9|nr:aminotransferase class III-fold pyridoxal phosphate-dependent enzyme [Schlesneria paludicola]